MKYVEHFTLIAYGMNHTGPDGMWDEEDGFYYDVLRLPDGASRRLKVRSIVGLLPLCATTVMEEWQRESVRSVVDVAAARTKQFPELLESIHATGPGHLGVSGLIKRRTKLAAAHPRRSYSQHPTDKHVQNG